MVKRTKVHFPKGGFVLIESVVVLIPVFLFFLMNLELIRRSLFEVVLLRVTCTEVRETVFGTPRNLRQKKIKEYLDRALGKQLAKSVYGRLEGHLFKIQTQTDLGRLKLGKRPGGVAERFYRYPQFIAFSYRNRLKHHQEIIKRCLFPF